MQPVLQGLDSLLKSDDLTFQERDTALEFFALDLLVREEPLDPPETFQDCLVLLLQAFHSFVQAIEVTEHLAEAFIDGFEALIVLRQLGLDPVRAAFHTLEAAVYGVETPVDLFELSAQEGYQVLVFAVRHREILHMLSPGGLRPSRPQDRARKLASVFGERKGSSQKMPAILLLTAGPVKGIAPPKSEVRGQEDRGQRSKNEKR